MNTIQDLNSAFGVGPRDRVLALSSLSFDLSVYDFFGMFEAGATVVMPTADAVSPPDPARWLELLRKEGVTVWNTVPRFMELLVSHVEHSGEKIPASLRLVFLSGDFIPLTLPGRIRTACACADVRIVSMGGATEAAVWSNIFEITQTPAPDPSWSSVPYGRPMRNQRMYVLNEAMEHCAPWVTGVLYIGGLGTALGYQGDAERTAYQFVKHPKTGEYLFRTGDLGRVRPWRRDGGGAQLQLEILGREDLQVKVGGHRVELGEIERILEGFSGVKASCVVVLLVDPTRPRLSGFVTAEETAFQDRAFDGDGGRRSFAADLKSFLLEQLPAYMVPYAIEVLETLPLNSNGKVDRGLLAKREPSVVNEDIIFGKGSLKLLEPRSPAEVLLVEIWCVVLGYRVDSIGVDENFFDLGGDSITSLRIVAKARAFGLRVTVREIFSHPTVQALARVAEYFGSASSSETPSSPKDPRFSKEGDDDEDLFLEPNPEALGDSFPLIGIQKGYWVGLQLSRVDSSTLAPQPIIFNEFEVRGELEVSRLEAAWRRLIRRHDMLRAVLTDAGELQVLPLHSTAADGTRSALADRFVVAVTDLSASNAETIAAQRQGAIAKRLQVDKWPLFECNAVRLRPNRSERADEMEYRSDTVGGHSLWLVQVKLSLVLLDALSEITLRRELELVYDALKVEADNERRSADSLSEDFALLPNIGVHFRDYVTALATQLPASAAYKRDLAHWTARLDTLPEPPALPLLPVATASIAALPAVGYHSFPQEGIATGTASTAPAAGATFRHLAGALSRDQWGHLKRMCARHSMTPTACLAAVYAHALAAWQAAPKDSAAESPQRCGPTDRVLINVMHTTRLPLHPDIGAVFGNFSSTSLLDACVNQTTPFADTAAKIAEQLASDLEHWRYGIALFFFFVFYFVIIYDCVF
jgi:nonribosomal peptide synthetase protein BlmIV